MSEQPTIDSLEFARHGKHLQGEIAVSDMARLREMLLSDKDLLHYNLSGSTSEKSAAHYLELSIRGKLVLECQRCLSPLDYVVDVSRVLELVQSEASFVPIEDEDEAVDMIPAESAMDVLALVEDEVLLGLPVAPRHAVGECGAVLAKDLQKRANPFEVLASLKKNV